MGGRSVDPNGGLGGDNEGREFVGSRLRLIAGVGVRMRASGGEDVDGNAESLSELVSFDDEVLPTESFQLI
jgi:hypothetical protein